MQADAQFDLLLVARLAIFEAASAWGEALRMFKRMQVRVWVGGEGKGCRRGLGGGGWGCRVAGMLCVQRVANRQLQC